jgi:hypothetical protein
MFIRISSRQAGDSAGRFPFGAIAFLVTQRRRLNASRPKAFCVPISRGAAKQPLMACATRRYDIEDAVLIQPHGVRFLHFARDIGRIAIQGGR